ncbi:MAG TPA: YetF domain-containing protein [Gemmatimonadaceae bacterium]|nr:YetF domain-containing protein [Gemmatimonadaceae bacterium]
MSMWSDLMTFGVPAVEKIARTIVVYTFLVAGLRLFGKRELGQLNPLDFIVLLLLSNTVQNAIIGNDNSLVGGLLGAAVLFIINDVLVRISYGRPRLRRFIEGRPEVLVHDGRMIKRALARNFITPEELVAAARKQGIQHLADVEMATLEVSGALSFTTREPNAIDRFHDEVIKRLDAIEKRLPAATAIVLAMLGAGPLAPRRAAAQAGTDVWVATLRQEGRRITLGTPVNVTHRAGYDNQPSFMPDGHALLYTSIGADGEADSWMLTLPGGAPRRLTTAPIGVYSPTVMPDGKWFSVIRVEADSTQRLWRFPLDGAGTPARVLERVEPVGYHAWLDDHTLALYVLGARLGVNAPATLQIADTRTGDATVVASGIGRALAKVPRHDAVSFVQVVRDSGQWLAEYDLHARTVRRLGRMPPHADYVAWTPGGALLTAAGSVVYQWSDGAWVQVAEFAGAGVRGISRLAVSPLGDRLAFVADEPRTP